MDALTLKATVHELNSVLKNSRIEKIYHPTAHELVLKTNTGSLLLSCHPTYFSIHMTKIHFDNPSSPSALTMILRKHLCKGHITGVDMDGFERIVTISIHNTDELFSPVSFKLIVELMGKHSNIILTDENGKILDSIKRIPLSVSRVRQVLPGLDYTLPPDKGDIPKELTEDYENHTGLYPFTKRLIREGVICIDDCKNSITNPHPSIVWDGKKPYAMSLSVSNHQCRAFHTMSEMLDFFHQTRDTSVQNTDLIKHVSTILQRLHRSIDIHEKNLNTSEDKYRIWGELLTSYAHQLKQGKTAEVLNYYTGETVTIPLKETLSINENAQKYYKRYNKIKSAKIHAKEQIEIISGQIEYLESTLVFAKNASSQKEIDAIKAELRENGFIKKSKGRTKVQKLDPIKYVSSSGFEIEVGRNSQQNDELTTKKARAKDVWCHVKEIPGSHVIVYTQGKEPDSDTILQACSIAAYHSKAKTSSNVPVDYTLVKHVKKPAHALPGKVIYTNQKTVYVTPDLETISALKK